MKTFSRVCAVALCLVGAYASTLQQLTLNDLILKSTLIVRGTVQAQTIAVQHGSILYTHYHVNVAELWKGAAPAQLDVAVPGGMLNGAREVYAGTPNLNPGTEYLMFLWTSRSGVTQIIGLSQGLFTISSTGTGDSVVSRAAATERMVDSNGRPVTDSDFTQALSGLRAQVQAKLRGGQ